MICQTCHGNHYVTRAYSTELGPYYETQPCPECIGGVSHCCDGDQPSDREEEFSGLTPVVMRDT